MNRPRPIRRAAALALLAAAALAAAGCTTTKTTTTRGMMTRTTYEESPSALRHVSNAVDAADNTTQDVLWGKR